MFYNIPFSYTVSEEKLQKNIAFSVWVICAGKITKGITAKDSHQQETLCQ